ncbi:uncharacterized protein LOC132163030 [Corylus avellana]|uniref:uncharacterized protein LOC132163030 n=1 Tax=Corylus avellana TaxID=13451 RepID=UPI00286CFCEF|nr:uncharacterized protein LOC132163030 [Corylus avellana]
MENRNKLIQDGFAEICRREMGFTRPRCFARRLSASEVLVKQLNLYGKLNGHRGCVNDLEFNSTGDLLVSGSDDKEVIFWNWATKTKLFGSHMLLATWRTYSRPELCHSLMIGE